MNGIIIVDKPEGWTSHDVIGKLRGVLKERRMGHGGTLDPMATGVLPVFIGRATRAVEFCENSEKEYVAGLRLGITTDTQDISGNIIKSSEFIPDELELRSVLGEFTGEIDQLPPMYSAIKIGGKKLYELARKGVEVERKPRRITIREIDLCEKRDSDYIIRFVCSKGTYIRTLCNDIGERLGCGGAMSYLRRTRAGSFKLEDAHTMSEILELTEQGKLNEIIRPVDSLFSVYSNVTIGKNEEKRCRCGNDFSFNCADGTYRVYSENNEFLMLGKCENGTMKTVKSFFEV